MLQSDSELMIPVNKQGYVLSEAAPALKAQLDRIEAKLDRLIGGVSDAPQEGQVKRDGQPQH